jgi:transcriptional regulator with XRE-family HTH domain
MAAGAVALPPAASTDTPARAPTNAALGRAIRRLRKARRLTIEALAYAADLHPTYLSGIERGVRNPTWSKLCALAETLGVPISTIAGEAEHDICPVCGALSNEQPSVR